MECELKKESTHDKFQRLGRKFNPGDKDYKVSWDQMSVSNALDLYGLGLQGAKGNNHEEQPSVLLHQIEYQKWKAYESRKGMSKEDAEKEFLKLAIPILEENGIFTEDPLKDRNEFDYNEC